MSIAHLTFIDIETVPEIQAEKLKLLTGGDRTIGLFNLFKKRFNKESFKDQERQYSTPEEAWDAKAALYAEYGKVVAISIGKWIDEDKTFYIRSITGRDESEILLKAEESIKRSGGTHLVAHNGLEFDFAFLMRRYIIHGLTNSMPPQLKAFGIKPWDLKLEDTMKMWSGSAWNYRCSLELLCEIMQITNPKKAIEGTSVAELFYGDDADALKKIGEYCSGDVLACAQVYSRIKGLPDIETVEYA